MNLNTAPTGTILFTSWGYDQTNIDFYEIIERRGKSTIVLRKLNATPTPQGPYQEDLMPIKGDYTGEKLTRRINQSGHARIESYARLHLWDGKPKQATSYA